MTRGNAMSINHAIIVALTFQAIKYDSSLQKVSWKNMSSWFSVCQDVHEGFKMFSNKNAT